MSVTALAHPNIALIKYWGKRDLTRNIPAVGSLSITLDTLCTKTRFDEAQSDSLSINGRSRDKDTVRVRKNLDDLRALCATSAGPVRVTSEVNFPVAAGLASSASGFA
ncbi:MAG: diphosphomevalonate decarboxylase, partial [Pseudomonadota bacterium]